MGEKDKYIKIHDILKKGIKQLNGYYVAFCINDIDTLFMEINKVLSRKEAKMIIEKSGFTKNKLWILGELFQIKITKGYRKDRIIYMIVDVAVGEKEDQNLINSIKI